MTALFAVGGATTLIGVMGGSPLLTLVGMGVWWLSLRTIGDDDA